MDLSHIPYQHRSSAADILVSKANRLTEIITIVLTGEPNEKQKKSLRKGISFYEIALKLMKPFDSNYITIKNW